MSRPARTAPAPRPLSRGPHRAFLAVLLAVLLALLTVPPAATGTPTVSAGARDLVSIGGYDLETDVAADVVAGGGRTNLALRYTAGRPLRDGTITLTLPRPAWRTPLHVGDALYAGDPSLDGSVVVRPRPDGDLGPQDCRGTSGPPTLTVRSTRRARVAVVSHLDCAAGQSVSVRVFGVRAPAHKGRATLPVSVSDAHGQRGPSRLRLPVVPRSTTRLRVRLPAAFTTNTHVPVVVRAVRPDGRTDTRYRGTVRLLAVEEADCTLSLDDGGEFGTATFTKADRGRKVVQLSLATTMSHRLVATDVSRRAQDGRSRPYTVVGPLEPVACPVSYH